MAMPVVHENLLLQCFNGFVSCCPPANVCLFSNAQPADWYVSQESATQAFRKLYHAGKETELVMRFQVPDPTLWVAKGSFDRFQFELSTGTSTTFAVRHLSCRLMAVQSPFHLLQVIDRSAILDISDRASIPFSFRVRRVNALAGETTLREK